MKNKFYASLFIGMSLTLASTPSLAKASPPAVKKPVSSAAKSAKKNTPNGKKAEPSTAKKAASSTVAKQKTIPTKNHLTVTKDSKHDKLKVANAKDDKHSKPTKSHQLADAKDSKHSKSKSQQLADAKDSKHSKSKSHQLADKDSKHSKSKSHQLADAKDSKHNKRKSHHVVKENYPEQSEEDTTVAEVEESEQTAEETNTEQSTDELASQETDTTYSEENSAKTDELMTAPPKSSQLFFQPLDKNAAQALTENNTKPSNPAIDEQKSTLSFSASKKTANNDRVHTLIDNSAKSNVMANNEDEEDNDEENPLPPSSPRERSDALIQPSQNKRVHSSIVRGDNSFIDNASERDGTAHVASTHGVVESSLASAGASAGLSEEMVVELTEIFAWDIDFANNLQAGDQFTVVYEAGSGNAHNKIIAAQFINRGRTYTAIRYKDQEGMVSYYTPEGRSTRKAFLITPVDFAKVSSHFSTHRKHPILNRIRAHKGVDYAARTGTPVKAAGDGVITFHGNQGGYGRMIVISHGDHYETAYAHLSNFKKGLQDGQPVKQGEVIGYVGQSGLATGPHLHYEFRVDGVHRDPENLDSKQAMHLADEEWDNFHAQTIPVLTRLNQAKANTLFAKNP